ncbi:MULTISPECIES: glycine--tRNA ligase subunit beta [Peptoniphilus]|uniref:glycine--tRNA ligase subunit beta n=1 Tax=Peptoniphilus TaxID=162289 RepID=UPI0002E90991|nr:MULTISPECIES: glycine--tRNA ligase subunit beta [Peptoniphilus]
MNRYLLEIGVEELPARFVNLAIAQMEDKAKKLLEENDLKYDSVEVYATPRRLTLIINDVELYQKDLDLEVKGPAKKIAFDEEGNPTKPLLGFMKSQNIAPENIVIKEFKGEEYVYSNIHKKGDSFESIVSKNIAELIKSINFPKNMKWGGKNIKFARPIRWIVSLLNNKVVPFEFEGIGVSNITRGHRFLGSSNIVVDEVDNYESLLKDNFVILNQNERREIIKYGSAKIAKSIGGEIYEDKDLLEELTYIVEYPNPIMGSIKDEYLQLPKEVITTPMRDHLRFIPIHASNGELLPNFITIRNGNDDYKDIVIAGNEKVLGARLEDAKFFYNDDISKSLESYIDSLKGVMFQQKLGTMYDKSERVSKLAQKIGENLEVADETIESIKRSAKLSKADLTTKMVQEFTELQGVMGSIYATKSGESEIVSQAIYEQYLPRFSNDLLPKSTTGSILAIADKIDTITGLFAIGLIPTGSQDPFALRRNARGIINIIESNKWDILIGDIVDYSLYIYTSELSLVFDYEKVKNSIIEFFAGRLKNMLQEDDIRYDIIDSVLSDSESVVNIFKKANELNKYFKEDKSSLIDAYTRLHNMAKKKDRDIEFEALLLSEPDEKALYEAQSKLLENVNKLIDDKEYIEALNLMDNLVVLINNYFDNIMVLVDDEKIKFNRLEMISKIDFVMRRILNIEKIVTD